MHSVQLALPFVSPPSHALICSDSSTTAASPARYLVQCLHRTPSTMPAELHLTRRTRTALEWMIGSCRCSSAFQCGVGLRRRRGTGARACLLPANPSVFSVPNPPQQFRA
jgi:hypothetical protein